MIRQAISCDICGTEKRQTNHWFVAFEQCGELRLGGWNTRGRSRPGSKHLCGQTCVHKLVDEYMAQAVGAKTAQLAADESEAAVTQWEHAVPSSERDVHYDGAAAKAPVRTLRPSVRSPEPLPADRNKSRQIVHSFATASAEKDAETGSDWDKDESSARLITSPEPQSPRPIHTAPEGVIPIDTNEAKLPAPTAPKKMAVRASGGDSPDYSSRRWRAEAWERERARELRASNQHPESAARVRAN